MAETPSTMLPLGTIAPNFKLTDTRDETTYTLEELKSNIATVVMFICNHCPYVIHIQAKLLEIVEKYQALDVKFIAISSNDAEKYPADGPKQMQAEAAKHDYAFPYLYDETQEVAKAYHAACTPDFYIFDEQLKCVYRGQFDNSTPGNNQSVTGIELTRALDNILAKKPVDTDQKPSVGCNIKWKK